MKAVHVEQLSYLKEVLIEVTWSLSDRSGVNSTLRAEIVSDMTA